MTFPFSDMFIKNIAKCKGLPINPKTRVISIECSTLVVPILTGKSGTITLETINLTTEIRAKSPSGTLTLGYGKNSNVLAVRWDGYGQTDFYSDLVGN